MEKIAFKVTVHALLDERLRGAGWKKNGDLLKTLKGPIDREKELESKIQFENRFIKGFGSKTLITKEIVSRTVAPLIFRLRFFYRVGRRTIASRSAILYSRRAK